MILLQRIKNINYLRLKNDMLYFINFKTKQLNVINEDLLPQVLVKKKVDSYVFLSNTIVYQSDNTIFKLGIPDEVIKKSKKEYFGLQDYLFESKVVVSLTKTNEWLANSMLLLKEDNSIEKLDFIFNNEIQIDNIYYNHNQSSVFAFNNSHKLIWKIDVVGFGRDIAKDPKTGEVLWDKPNEIKEDLLADDKNIYVPLKGGQLLALNSQTGKKVWMWEHPRNGAFAVQGEFIYKQDGLTIFEINTNTGDLVRRKNFIEDKLVDNFHASGPLWVYENTIIVCDVLYGKICLLNRHTFEVEDFFSLNKKLVNSKTAIVWNDNKLYVLDIEQTLHVFEKEDINI